MKISMTFKSYSSLMLAAAGCCWLLLTAADCWGTWPDAVDLAAALAKALLDLVGPADKVLFRA
jgi:hypothetical protein